MYNYQPDPNATPDAEAFFEQYLAAPIVLLLYLFWKVYSGNWRPWVKLADIDLMAGARPMEFDDEEIEPPKTWANLPMRILRFFF